MKSIKDLEKELSLTESKSSNHEKFLGYVKLSMDLFLKIKHQYNTEYLEKLKWYSYLNKRKHESNLMKKIEDEFGSNATIIIGDWSNKGRIKFAPTPNLSLKRKLKEHFTVYHIDEYNTSCMHYKENIKCGKMSVNVIDKETESSEKSIFKQLHAVLTYKIVSEENAGKNVSFGCINRDKNSVLNMDKIFQSLLSGQGRPSLLSRARLTPKKGNSSKALSTRRTPQAKTLNKSSSTNFSSNPPNLFYKMPLKSSKSAPKGKSNQSSDNPQKEKDSERIIDKYIKLQSKKSTIS
jgi:hypothetical protein